MKAYTYTEFDLQEFANQIKDLLIIHFENDGLLTFAAEEVGKKYVVCLSRKNLFGKFFEKISGRKTDDEIIIHVLKIDN
jgi:hypothetical protein